MTSQAQNPATIQDDPNSTLGTNPFAVEDEDATAAEAARNKPDTVKKKPKKPLESYFFNDSIRKGLNFAWNVDLYRNQVYMTTIDTLPTNLQIDYPFLRQDVGSAYLGNLGGAAIPLSYFSRPEYRNFSFASAYDAYYVTPERARFFNVKAPFTHLSYQMSGQTSRYEENFGLTHAQNISPSTGFNLDYKSRGTRGIYSWQRARDKNLSMAFSHTGKKYTVHAGYIFNGVDANENGGIADDGFITDTILELPNTIPTNLKDAKTRIRDNTYYLVQSYGIPLQRLTDEDFSIDDRPALFLGTSTEYSRRYKRYSDTYAGSNSTTNGNFYDNWYINPAMTYDSIFESLLANRAFIQIQPWDRNAIVGVIDAGAGIDIHKYYQFAPDQYISGNRGGVKQTSIYVYGAIRGRFKKYFDWEGDLRYHPAGYRSQDYDIGGKVSLSAYIKGHPATLSASLRNTLRTPDYWSESLFSNHFAWSNSFEKENETRIELKLEVPVWALELGAYQNVVDGKIYYDERALAAQQPGSVSVSGLYVHKNFRLGGFNLNHRVLLQGSSLQKVIPVPLLSAYLSYFFEFDVVRNVLRIQTGVDARFNTKYYGYGYMPALAQFYNQQEKELGNYLLLDAFLAAKWKRMRILFKVAHFNENMFGPREYFQVIHYPLNPLQVKLGFSWAFYN